jgi:hypothetical protein
MNTIQLEKKISDIIANAADKLYRVRLQKTIIKNNRIVWNEKYLPLPYNNTLAVLLVAQFIEKHQNSFIKIVIDELGTQYNNNIIIHAPTKIHAHNLVNNFNKSLLRLNLRHSPEFDHLIFGK